MEAVRVVVIGAGGHARVVLEALADSGHEVAGCVSADGTGVDGLPCPVLGCDTDVAALAAAAGATGVFVAVGDNAARRRLQDAAVAAGLVPVNAVSRFAMVSSSAVLGRGVLVAAGAVVNAMALVGDGAILNTRCSIDHDVVVGPFAHVSVGVVTGGAFGAGAIGAAARASLRVMKR